MYNHELIINLITLGDYEVSLSKTVLVLMHFTLKFDKENRRYDSNQYFLYKI